MDHSKLAAYTPLLAHVIEDAGTGEDAAAALRAAFRALQSLLGLSDPPTLAKHAQSTLPLLLSMTRRELHAAMEGSTGAAKDQSDAPPSTLQLLDESLHTIAKGLNAAVGSSVYHSVFSWVDEQRAWEDHRFVAHILRRLDRQSAAFLVSTPAGGGSAGGGGAQPTASGDNWGPILGANLPMLLLRHASQLAEQHRHGAAVGGAVGTGSGKERRGTLLVTATPTGDSGDGVKLLGMLFAARTLLQEATDTLRVGDIASDVVDLVMPLLVASVAHDLDSQAQLITPAAAARSLQSQQLMGSVHEEVCLLLLCLAQRLSTAHELHRLATAVADWYGEFQEELLDMLQATADGQALVKAAMPRGPQHPLLQLESLGGPLPLSSSHLVTPARLHVLALIMSLLKQVVSLRWQHSDSAGVMADAAASAVTPTSAEEAALMSQVQLSNSFIPVPPQDVLVEVLLRDMCDASASVRSMALQCVLVSLTSPLEWGGTFQGTSVVHGAVLQANSAAQDDTVDVIPVLDAGEAEVLGSAEMATSAVEAGLARNPHYPLVIRQMFSLPLTPLQLVRLHSALLHSIAASCWRQGSTVAFSLAHGSMATRICAAVLQRAGIQGVWFVWGLGSALVKLTAQLAVEADSPDTVQRVLLLATIATALLHLVCAPATVATHLHLAHDDTAANKETHAPVAQPGLSGMLEAVPESGSDDEGVEGGVSPPSTPAEALAVATALEQLLQVHGSHGALVLPCSAADAAVACVGLLLPAECGCVPLLKPATGHVAVQLSARAGGLLLKSTTVAVAMTLPDAADIGAVEAWAEQMAAAAGAVVHSAPFQHTAQRVSDIPARYVKRCFPALFNSVNAELRRCLQLLPAGQDSAFKPPGALPEESEEEHAYVHGMFRLIQVLQPASSVQRVVACSTSAAAEMALPAPVAGGSELHQHTTTAVAQSPDSVLAYMAHLLSLPLLPLPVPPFDVEEEDEDADSTGGSEDARSAAGGSIADSTGGGAAPGSSSRPTSPSSSVVAGDASVTHQGSGRGAALLSPPAAVSSFGDAVHLEGGEELPTPQAAVQRMQTLATQLQRAQQANKEAAEEQRRQLLRLGAVLPAGAEGQHIRIVAPPGADNAGQLLPPASKGADTIWPTDAMSLASSSAALRAAGHTESMPYLLPHGVAGAPKVAM